MEQQFVVSNKMFRTELTERVTAKTEPHQNTFIFFIKTFLSRFCVVVVF